VINPELSALKIEDKKNCGNRAFFKKSGSQTIRLGV
jgi:hypothetical protein